MSNERRRKTILLFLILSWVFVYVWIVCRFTYCGLFWAAGLSEMLHCLLDGGEEAWWKRRARQNDGQVDDRWRGIGIIVFVFFFFIDRLEACVSFRCVVVGAQRVWIWIQKRTSPFFLWYFECRLGFGFVFMCFCVWSLFCLTFCFFFLFWCWE